MKKFFLLIVFAILATGNVHAKPKLLPAALENEVIALLEDLGVDSWEEGGVEAKFDTVSYDPAQKTLIVTYELREMGSNKAYEKQEPILILGINSTDEIVEQSPNGFRSLSEKISDRILESI